jgi:hypothetical protein
MTVSSSTAKAGPYAGSGTTGPFSVPFRFLEDSHLRVIRTTTGLDTDLTLTTDYTVSGAGAASGTVTLVTALAVGETLTIVRDVPATQEADYVANGPFPAESHEQALDKLTMLVQQNVEELDRTLRLPATTSGVSTELPRPVAGQLIGWDGAGTGLTGVDRTTLATVVAYGSANADVFTGTGSQTVFVLSADPGVINNLDVSINGVVMVPGIDYTWVSGTTLTFTAAPPAASTVLVRYDQGLPVGTADAGATNYVPAGMGAVATNVQNKLREFVSVKDFGAVGDGVADDTVAIQAALDAVYASGGGTLYFPAGEYLVTSIVKVFASNISVVFKGAGKMATVLRKTGASTTPILDLSTTVAPSVVYSSIEDMRIRGNAKAHDGIRLTNWARFSLENVYVNACDVGINNRGSLVFLAKGCTIVSNNTGYKADVSSAIGANLYEFYGGSISSNTTLGVDLGDGTGFSFHLVDFGGNGTAADLNTGAVLIRGAVDDSIGVAFGSFSSCWFELNKGTTIRAEASELHLGFKDTQCLSAEGGNVMNIGDIRSIQLINFVAPSAPDTVTVAAKNFTSIGGIIGAIVDNSTTTSNVFGTSTATAAAGTRSRQFNPQIGASTSYGIAPGVVFKNGTATANVGSAETDLRTYTLPANAFSATAKGVRITAFGTTANNANAKTLRVYFDGVVIGSIALTTSQANTFRADGEVMYDVGTTSRAIMQIIQGGTATQTLCTSTTVAAYTTSNPAIIKVTGQGVADSDVVLRGIIIEFIA